MSGYAKTLSRMWAGEWLALSAEQRALVYGDFLELLRDEYDVPDDTNEAEEDSIADAGVEYRRRIGKGNLAAYARALAAGKEKRDGR